MQSRRIMLRQHPLMPVAQVKMKAGLEEEDSLPPAEKFTRGLCSGYASNSQLRKTKTKENQNQALRFGRCMVGEQLLEMGPHHLTIPMIFADGWTIA